MAFNALHLKRAVRSLRIPTPISYLFSSNSLLNHALDGSRTTESWSSLGTEHSRCALKRHIYGPGLRGFRKLEVLVPWFHTSLKQYSELTGLCGHSDGIRLTLRCWRHLENRLIEVLALRRWTHRCLLTESHGYWILTIRPRFWSIMCHTDIGSISG